MTFLFKSCLCIIANLHAFLLVWTMLHLHRLKHVSYINSLWCKKLATRLVTCTQLATYVTLRVSLRLLVAQRSKARHLLSESMSVCPSVCLSVCHTRQSRLNGSVYRNIRQMYDRAMFLVSWGQISRPSIYGFIPNNCVKEKQPLHNCVKDKQPLSTAKIGPMMRNISETTREEVNYCYSHIMGSRIRRLSIGTEISDVGWPWTA